MRNCAAPRPIQISASEPLIEPLNFYRRRYALGAVQPVVPGTPPALADYSILLERDLSRLQGLPHTQIFNKGSVYLMGSRQKTNSRAR